MAGKLKCIHVLKKLTEWLFFYLSPPAAESGDSDPDMAALQVDLCGKASGAIWTKKPTADSKIGFVFCSNYSAPSTLWGFCTVALLKCVVVMLA